MQNLTVLACRDLSSKRKDMKSLRIAVLVAQNSTAEDLIGDFNVPVNKTNNEYDAVMSSTERRGFYKPSFDPPHVKWIKRD